MSDAEMEAKIEAVLYRRAPRAALTFVTAYLLLWLQAYHPTGWFWIAFMVAFLSLSDVGIPVTRFALGVLALMVLVPPPLAATFGGWVKSLG